MQAVERDTERKNAKEKTVFVGFARSASYEKMYFKKYSSPENT